MGERGLPSLKRPSTGAWTGLVQWFAANPAACGDDHPALVQAREALAAWPASVVRPIPFVWIFRLFREGGFPPAELGNALCLGDRWAFHREITLDGFRTLDEDRTHALARMRLPNVRSLDLSLQSADNPLCPGTLFYLDDETACALVFGETFASVQALDCSGIGLDLSLFEESERAPPKTLVLRECNESGDLVEALCASPRLLGGLVHLDISHNFLGEEDVRELLESPHLGSLRTLRGLDRESMGPEIEASIEQSSLVDTLKAALLAGDEGEPAVFFSPAFLGAVGGPLEEIDADGDDGDDGD